MPVVLRKLGFEVMIVGYIPWFDGSNDKRLVHFEWCLDIFRKYFLPL